MSTAKITGLIGVNIDGTSKLTGNKLQTSAGNDINFPSSGGTLATTSDIPSLTNYVTKDAEETLTNKTLTEPTIASIKPSADYTLTLPSQTSTLATVDDISPLSQSVAQAAFAQSLLDSDPYQDQYLAKNLYLDLRNEDFTTTTTLYQAYKSSLKRYILWNLRNAPTFGLATTCAMMFQSSVLRRITFPQSVTFDNVTTASQMFGGCTSLVSVHFPESVTFRSLTDAQGMFGNCRFTHFSFPSSITFDNVTTTKQMVAYCPCLRTIHFPSSITFHSLTTAQDMFNNCYSLHHVEFPSSIRFESLTDMSNMFGNCYSLRYVIFPKSAELTNVTTMATMFSGCKSLQYVIFPEAASFANVTSAGNMFGNCYSLRFLVMRGDAATKLKSLSNTPLTWNITPTDDSNMHLYTVSYYKITAESNPVNLPLNGGTYEDSSTSSISTASFAGNNTRIYDKYVKSANCTLSSGYSTFAGAYNVVNIDIQNVVFPSSSTTVDCTNMFKDCYSLQTITWGSSMTLKEVSNASYMFANCTSITYIPLPSTTTFANLTNASYMFQGCSSLKTAYFPSSMTLNKVSNTSYMFKDCSALETIIFSADTTFSSLSSASSMFQNCYCLSSIVMTGIAATKLRSSSTGLLWDSSVITSNTDTELHTYLVQRTSTSACTVIAVV